MDDRQRARFRKKLREIRNLPTLPGIVVKLNAMAADPEITTEQIGKAISKDHILSAKLLKLVNSAFYGFPQRIGSLSSAIILLGFNVINSLIMSASIFEVMEKNDADLWKHSLGCAVVSNIVARHMGVEEPEEVSTAGLIHDLGKVAIKLELAEEYQKISQLVHSRRMSMRQLEMEIFGFDHAEVGAWLAKRWNLPSKLVEPIRCHHEPGKASGSDRLASAIVHFSDIVIRALGYGHGDDQWVPPLSKEAWSRLGLGPEDIDRILEQVEDKLWDVKGFSLEIEAQGEVRPGGTPGDA